jgi:hypothetical protein
MPGGRKPRWKPAALEAALEAVVTGTSYEVAERLTGVPRSTISDHVERLGVHRDIVPRPGRKKTVDGASVAESQVGEPPPGAIRAPPVPARATWPCGKRTQAP